MTLPRRCSVKCGAASCAVGCERERAPREPEPPRPVPALGPLGDTTLRSAFRTAMGLQCGALCVGTKPGCCYRSPEWVR